MNLLKVTWHCQTSWIIIRKSVMWLAKRVSRAVLLWVCLRRTDWSSYFKFAHQHNRNNSLLLSCWNWNWCGIHPHPSLSSLASMLHIVYIYIYIYISRSLSDSFTIRHFTHGWFPWQRYRSRIFCTPVEISFSRRRIAILQLTQLCRHIFHGNHLHVNRTTFPMLSFVSMTLTYHVTAVSMVESISRDTNTCLLRAKLFLCQ